MKYLKFFKKDNDYQNYVKSDDYNMPNVSYTEDTDIVYYNYIPPIPDIVYYDGSSLKTIHPLQYNTSMGTAVGVIVIPEGMLPDGKARFIALQDASASTVTWGIYGTDISLTNYNRVPTTNNSGSTTNGSYGYGYLPSDHTDFTGVTSYVDPKTKYIGSTYYSPYVPSPYLADDSLNPAYYEAISGYNNVFSDFNGKSNTDVLVGLGSAYTAANIAKNYAVDGVDIDWYLPACGELGFLMPRLAAINESIAVAGGIVIVPMYNYWTSTEYASYGACYVNTSNGGVNSISKSDNHYVRSFAML